MHVHEERKLVGSAELSFTCPSCKATNQTDALQFETVDKYLGLITLWKTKETAVKCPACEATCRTNIGLEKLTTMSTGELASQFRIRIGLVEKFLVIAAWVLFIALPLSLPMFIIAWFIIPKAASGWRLAAKIGMIASGLLLLFFVVLMLFS